MHGLPAAIPVEIPTAAVSQSLLEPAGRSGRDDRRGGAGRCLLLTAAVGISIGIAAVGRCIFA